MSPKSRGRPKGRGRPINKRQPMPTRRLTPHERVMVDALSLDDDAHPFAVETAASQWLGKAWAKAGLDQRHPERDLVEALIGELQGTRAHPAYLALSALLAVAAPGERDLIRQHLASDAPLLTSPWAGETAVTPRAAWRAGDVYGSVVSIFVGYDAPEPHELAVYLTTVGGLYVEHIGLLEPGSHGTAGVTGTGTAAVGVTPDQALSEIAEALMTTDMYWPRQTDPDYTELRAVAHARSRDFAVEREWQPIGDDERRDLIESFVAETDTTAPDDVLRGLADTFIDFGDRYLAGGVLAWSPGEVERFLTDWVVRKVILDAEDRAALPAVLKSWLAFALARRGLEEQDIAPVVAAVDELEGDFQAAYDDESAWGPGRQVATALLERGVDLTDQDALEAAIRAYNADQLARRLQEPLERRG